MVGMAMVNAAPSPSSSRNNGRSSVWWRSGEARTMSLLSGCWRMMSFHAPEEEHKGPGGSVGCWMLWAAGQCEP